MASLSKPFLQDFPRIETIQAMVKLAKANANQNMLREMKYGLSTWFSLDTQLVPATTTRGSFMGDVIRIPETKMLEISTRLLKNPLKLNLNVHDSAIFCCALTDHEIITTLKINSFMSNVNLQLFINSL